MFRVEFLVEDKRLAAVLRVLASAGAYNVMAVPAVDAKAVNGKVKQASLTSAKSNGLPPKIADLWAHIEQQGATAFDNNQIRAWMLERGLSAGSTTYAVKRLVEAKLVKSIGRGKWEVRQ